ncbi:MAG: hypothetical protein E7385_04820 [Ruminococcaceae bacterium]|nr:hypothetical protein [Oscillospiraceae bacterium]
MKSFYKYTILVICLLLCFSTIPVLAETVNADVSGEPNEQIVVEFSYTGIAGINGTVNLSNPDIFSQVDVEVTGLQGFYNPDNGVVSFYGTKNIDVTVILRLTVANTAQAGNVCDITFVYETVTEDGDLPSEPDYKYDYATVTIVNSINFDALKAQIARAETLNESKYTAVSWAKMKTALANARGALTSRSQDEVDKRAKELKSAIDNLVELSVDYSELKKQIQRAEDLVKDDYTEESWNELEKALSNAKEALNSKDQLTVNNAASQLKAAINDLEQKENDPDVNYYELRRQIGIAEGLKEVNYTPESWSQLKSALSKARAALSSTNQNAVDKAASDLEHAIEALVRATASENIDYTELLRQIAVAESLNEMDYLVDSWNEMIEALEYAYTATNSTVQSAVDMAATSLKEAIEKLVRVDYSALLAAIDEVNKYTESNEIADLWDKMHKLLNEAQILLTGRDQNAINKCAEEIAQLLSEIIKKMSELAGSTVIIEKPIPTEPDYDFCNMGMHRVWPILFWVSLVLNLAFVALITTFILRKRRKESDDTPLVDYDISDDEE